jgi:alanine racemase
MAGHGFPPDSEPGTFLIRCTFAHVDLDALKSNFRTIAGFLAVRRAIEPRRPASPGIIAVVKANAYGHGAGPVGLALQQAGATMLACADIEEAIVLREAGVSCAVLVFGALSVSDVAGLFEYDLTPTISTPSTARALQAAAARRATRLHYHLKIDTGMNRLGFRHDNLRNTLPELLASPNLLLDAVYTHFGTADDFTNPLFDDQRRRFDEAVRTVRSLGGRPRALHAANSAALLRDTRVWFDHVRPGLLLYGISPVTGVPGPGTGGRGDEGPPGCQIPGPDSAAGQPTLAPVMTLRSRVVAVKGIRTGESIGYGALFTAARPTDIAIVPAGYADGLDLRLAGRASVLVAGRRAPIVGSICMDMITVDVTGIPVEPGDAVVILGRDGDEEIGVREMAQAIGTIPYEILCRIGTRIERVYNPR